MCTEKATKSQFHLSVDKSLAQTNGRSTCWIRGLCKLWWLVEVVVRGAWFRDFSGPLSMQTTVGILWYVTVPTNLPEDCDRVRRWLCNIFVQDNFGGLSSFWPEEFLDWILSGHQSTRNMPEKKLRTNLRGAKTPSSPVIRTPIYML